MLWVKDLCYILHLTHLDANDIAIGNVPIELPPSKKSLAVFCFGPKYP